MTDLNTADARLVAPAARTLPEDQSIRPFRVTIPEKELVELRRRIAAARWPTKELGRRACSWRHCGSLPATGRPSTTGAKSKHD